VTERPTSPSEPHSGDSALDRATVGWDGAYRSGHPPWDIDRPQPVFVRLADAGEVQPPVLDCGCGTGEQTLMLAERGIDVLGLDLAPSAIAAARRKAAERGLASEFMVGNALALADLDRTFATVIDSGVFHVFNDADRARYVAGLAAVLRAGGVLHLLCFSEHTPGTGGPRRVTRAELRAAFAEGWEVERIEAARFEVLGDFADDPPHAWLARVVRR
jgi:SAM-dependent methyltransferase